MPYINQKPALATTQKLGQKLSHQQAQFMRMVQMPSIELQQELSQITSQNPLLEINDEIEEDFLDELSKNSEDEEFSDANSESNDLLSKLQNDIQSGEIYTWENEHADINQNEDLRDQGFNIESNYESSKLISSDDLENSLIYQSDSEVNIFKTLLIEAKAKAINDVQRALVELLIGNLDEKGFLSDDLESFRADIFAKTQINLDIIEYQKALELIQCLDPAGIAAKNTQECLQLQAERLPQSRLRRDCELILSNKILYNLLLQKRSRKLLEKLDWENERLADAINTIAQFTTDPAKQLITKKEQVNYIIAEVLVRKINHRWQVISNERATPRIYINPKYSKIINKLKNNHENTNSDIKEKLREAQNLIRDLKSRENLILQIANYIVDFQRNYFELGDIAIKPLLQKDLAREFNLHYSSVSRIISGKYMDTPQGILPFSYFIVRGKISSDYGAEYSSTSVVAMIREYIAKESPLKPLSDDKIGKLLLAEGVKINTRTIAKYRMENDIPSWFERKKK